LIGGTGTTDTLTFKSTSGVGTTGADIIFKTGNNGATEVGRFLNSGKFKLAQYGAGTFTGTPTFALQVDSTGNIIEGSTATGVTTLSAIGSSPNANGATITGSVLNLEPASASFGGVVTTGTQTFAGDKTFSNYIQANGVLTVTNQINNQGNTTVLLRLTNAGSDLSYPFYFGNGGNTAGNSGIFMTNSNSNGLLFSAANGTRQIARASIQITNLGNTAGSESGDLIFLTQSGGTAVSEKLRIGSTGILTLATSPSASAGGYEVLTRNTSTGVVEKIASSSFTVPLNNVAAANTTATIGNGDNAIVWNWALTTAAKTAFTFGETTAAANGAGNQSLVDISTLATSTASPLRVTSNGTADIKFNLASTGDLLIQDNGTAIASFLDTGAITFAPTSGQSLTNTLAGAGTFTINSGVTTGTTTTSAFAGNFNSLTSGTGMYLASSTLTSGSLLNISSSGTAAATNQKGLNIALTGTNATSSVSSYGAYISNGHDGTGAINYGLYSSTSASNNTQYAIYGTATGTGGGPNVYGGYFSATAPAGTAYGLYATATGADNNYAIVVPSGGGSVGVGTVSPTNLFSVGSSSQFQVDNNGDFLTTSGATTGNAGLITANSATSGNILSLTSSSAAATTGQKGLNVALTGALTGAQTTYGGYFSNTRTGASAVNVGLYSTASGATGGNYAAIFDQGNVGIGTATPQAQLEITGNFRIADQQTDTNASNGIIYKDGTPFIHNYRHPTGGGARPNGSNTFVGLSAGNLTMGSTATATYQASNNSGFGVQVLNSDTTGYYNSGFGVQALTTNTTGYSNSAFGMYALKLNDTGYSNSAFGIYALERNTSGYYNAALGYFAGGVIADGSTSNQTSNTSVYLGASTKALADGDTNEIVLGYNTTGFGSNTAAYGNSSITRHIFQTGEVQIGSTSDLGTFKLQVTGNAIVDSLNVSGLTASSAVYTDGSKNLTSTAPTSGAIGYWSRSGTTLSPATANDIVTISTNAATGAPLALTSSAITTTGSSGFLNTVTVSGSAASETYYGEKLALTNNQATNADTLYGQHISFTDAGSLANTVTGLYVDATTANTADTTYAAAFMGGRVGIGTATPTGILDVSDGTRSYFKVAGTETGGVSILLRNDPIYLSITGNASAGATISGANHVLFTIPVTLDTTNLTLQNGSGLYITQTGVIANQLGGTTAPSYTFNGDLDTGIWSPGANTLAFSTGTAGERMRINSAGELQIGSMTDLGTYALQVTGNTKITGQTDFGTGTIGSLYSSGGDSVWASSSNINIAGGVIRLNANGGGSGGARVSTDSILFLNGGNNTFAGIGGGNSGALYFYYDDSFDSPNEGGRFNTAGELQIGSTSDLGAYKLQVTGDTDQAGDFYSTASGVVKAKIASSNGLISAGPGGINIARNDTSTIGVSDANIVYSSADIVIINKNLAVAGGVYGTSSYSIASNNLTIGYNTLSASITASGSGDAYKFDTSGAQTGGNLLNIKNNATSKFAIDYNGQITAPFYGGGGTQCIKTDNVGLISAGACGGAGSTSLNTITLATGTNTIDNTNYAQQWDWSTASTQNPFTWTANALTTGTLFNLTSTSTAFTTGGLLNISATGAPGTSWTGDLAKIEYNNADVDVDGTALKLGLLGAAGGEGTTLNVTTAQTGTNALAFRVNDDGTYTDSSPFIIDKAGNVGIQTTSATSALTVAGNAEFTTSSTSGFTFTNATASSSSGVLRLNATSSSDFVPGARFSTTQTGTGALTASYGLQNFWTSSAVVAGASVSQTAYGIYNNASKTGADTATGTYTLYGSYNTADNTGRTAAGTVNTYGGYFAATGDTAGASTAIGLYATASGANNNYAAIFNAGNVGIANTAPQYKLHVGAGNDVSDIASTELAIFQNNGSSSISVRDASTNAEAYIYADGGGSMFGSSGNYPVQIGSNAGTSIYIDTSNNLNIGGDISPNSLFTVGPGSEFQVNSSGAIASAAGIISSGTIQFSALTSNGPLYTSGGNGTLTTTAPTSGAIGYWSRSGTTLSATTANDVVTLNTTNTTGADLGITNTGVYTGTGIFNLTANSATTGTLASITGNGLTSGSLLSLSSNGTTAANGQKGLSVTLAGNVGTTITTYAGYFDNSHTRTAGTPVNIGVYGNASSGGADNYGVYGQATGGNNNFAGYFTNDGAAYTPVTKILNTSTATNGYTQMAIAGGQEWSIGVGNTNETALSLASKFFIYYPFGGIVPLTIDTSGNVGIADTTPDALFDIDSNATTGTNLGITNTGVYTGTGIFNITANSASSGKVQSISANNLTTGYALDVGISNGTLTTGGAINVSGATYSHANGQTGSLVNLSVSNGSATGGALTSTTNGINIDSNFNTTNATSGVKTLNAINVGAPTFTACTGGATCTWNGLRVNNTASTSVVSSTGILINGASSGSAGTQIGLDIGGITAGTATETAIRVGSGWDTVIGGTTAGTNLIGFTNFTVATSGNLDTQGTIQAGSSNITLTTAAGTIDASTALTLTSSDGTGSTSNGSGLEVGNTTAIGLLQGCADGEILKWTESTSVWSCATDATGGGAGSFTSSAGVINKTTASDRLNLLYGDAADTQFTIENTTNGTIPTADAMKIDLTGGTTGMVTASTEALSIAWEAGDMTSGGTISGINLAFTPISTGVSSTDLFNGLTIANITGTSATESAISIGAGWDVGVRMFETNTGNGTNSVSISAPASITTDYTITLPDKPSANGCMNMDTNGTITVATCGDVNYNVFTSNTTYTKKAGVKSLIIEAIGGGGSGGGGQAAAVANPRMGGSGGGGGAYVTKTFDGANFTSSAVNVQAPAAVTGGASATNGTAGDTACVSVNAACSATSTVFIEAYGGGRGGKGGIAAAGSGGGGGGGTGAVGSNSPSATGGTGGGPNGGAANASGGQFGGGGGGTATNTAAGAGGSAIYGGGGGGSTAGSNNAALVTGGAGGTSIWGGGGGGAGGQVLGNNAASAGGAGGKSGGTQNWVAGGGGAGGGAAAGAGGNGANSADANSTGTAGYGGGGGGANNAAAGVGGAGGNGGNPGGGGGGGGPGVTGGAGGNGGRGEVRIIEIRGASGADLGEFYATNDPLIEAADVVSFDPDLEAGVKMSSKKYDSNVAGVISTQPDMVMGSGMLRQGAKSVVLALAGRVPVKVSAMNGIIKPGDYLTTSSHPGWAMKATKAGHVIGQALTGWNPAVDDPNVDPDRMGVVILFVQPGYYNGQKLESITEDSTLLSGLTPNTGDTPNTPEAPVADKQEFGQKVLAKLLSDVVASRTAPGPTVDPNANTLDMSDLYADRLVAAVEIITPKITTDVLATNTLKSATGDDINLILNENGKFIIGTKDGTNTSNSVNPAIVFDSLGNATFKGTVTAHDIKLGDISGVQAITDQINSLAEGQQAFTLTAEGMNTLSSALTIAQADIKKLQEDLTTASTTIAGLTTSGTDLDTRLKVIESFLTKDADGNVNGFTMNMLSVTGDSSFAGQAKFNGLSFFSNTTTFDGDVVFSKQAEFSLPPLFNKDTAGYALIKAGDRRAKIVFDKPYISTPVVNASMTFEKDDNVDDSAAASLFGEDIRYIVVDKDQTGFTILLNKTPNRDIRFSWTVFSVKDPKIFESILEETGLTPDPVPTNPPPTDGGSNNPPPADNTQPPTDGGSNPPPADNTQPPTDGGSNPPPADNTPPPTTT
jgi:hypothetical protein